ncbi:hypothetical protein IHV12_02960 [Fictibacillus sp. 7GRE50]|uniref:hypothetical protein n=1 Tax=Fictibacillus sp. 7GRE50 TaxID=2745878 RepID=UPI0018CF6138|nr:hypothetical protein [Fictibacillus sp. 7GRE50]MBH0163855.1 hypothetical protein [Fictibacillus sp. 7GRE50]
MIGVEGARLLRDKRSGETLSGAKRQVAHRLPRGKRSTWSGNQQLATKVKAIKLFKR